MNIEKTRTELIAEAAFRLEIVGTGQSLDAEYSARIDNNVDPLLLQLAADGICNVVNDQHIPSEWFDALCGLLANMCAPVGGKTYDPAAKTFYEMQLRRLTSNVPSYSILEGEYF